MKRNVALTFWCVCIVAAFYGGAAAQARDYPKEIRGYKVERTAVEMKKTEVKGNAGQNKATNDANAADDVDQLITFGRPELARVTPLGITFTVPIVVAPVKQSGHVDFLLFEEMSVNGHSVEIDEYHRAFDLPNKKALTLGEPLRFYIYLPVAALAAMDDWSNAKETWPVTGRVYVFGKFKKSILGIPASFKRCVPVELDLAMKNPLKAE